MRNGTLMRIWEFLHEMHEKCKGLKQNEMLWTNKKWIIEVWNHMKCKRLTEVQSPWRKLD